LLLYPEIISYLKQKQSNQTVKELTQRRSKRKQADLLYQNAVRYNRKILKEKQAGLKDVFSYRSAPIDLRNTKNTFGYIKLPKMKQKLPLYLGATMENMR
ncbi:class C sortase, partial [Anaerostipes hadrus]|nr:class C sortase [Anaerostipes hadrus]